MKPKLANFSLNIILLLITVTPSICQDWNWRWANWCSNHNSDVTFEKMHVSFTNNIYSLVPYYTTWIYFEDTVLAMDGFAKGSNYALAKFNVSGSFIDAMIFKGNTLMNMDVAISKSSTLYAAGTFTFHMVIQDSTFYQNDGSNPNSPEVFLAKIGPDYSIKWFGLISDPYADYFKGLAVSEDGSIYISTYHYANFGYIEVNYFDQLTSEPFNTPMSTIVKLDTNLNIQWIKEIRSEYLGQEAEELFIGDDNLIYISGGGYAHFYVDDDTIFHPVFQIGLEATYKEFLLSFNDDGELQNGFYLDWDIGIGYQRLEIDASSNLCIAGSIHDTAVIGTDTIIVPDGLYYTYIGKFNQSLEPIWYEVIEETQTQGVGFSKISLSNDNIIAGGYGIGNFEIADTTFSLGNFSQGIVCEFDSVGILQNYLTTECTGDLYVWDVILDNCGNPLICGSFNNKVILGNDTLLTYSNQFTDGFITKINRAEPGTVELGTDTLACEEFTIYGPLGYMYYSWNNAMTNQNWYTAKETGILNFACSNEDGCWLYDTIYITIHPGFKINLGPDTTISINESLVFTVPDGYESYLWSNTVTANAATVFGESYDPGTIVKVWVQVTDGPCIVTDTVYVTIKSEFAVEDYPSTNLFFYPNPFTDCLYIKSDSQINQIKICDLNGLTLLIKDMSNPQDNIISINMEDLSQGIYILRLVYRESEVIKKIVKL